MLSSRVVRLGTGVAALAVAVTAGVFSLGGSGALASDHSSGKGYLALGDSVVFGYIAGDGFAYGNAHNFVGYPDYVGEDMKFDTVNASCPGEATGGFLSLKSPDDNGCRAFRSQAPLHVNYSTDQMDFATTYLKAHHDTRLVTLGIGANDAFILQTTCKLDPTCITNGLPALLATISANVDTILKGIKATGFHGVLMVVNYYSLNYADLAGTGLTALLNQAITTPAKADGAVVADAFKAFQAATNNAFAGGNTCKQGLINAAPQDPLTFNPLKCDVHPSQSGQQLLAQTVEAAYREATED